MVDATARRPYVRPVNLLLLLSALLSALTGVGGVARAGQAPVAVSRTAEITARAPISRAAIAGRPIATLPSLPTLAVAFELPAPRLSAAVPLWLNRRRE
jgi:hypothetical protein